MKFSKVRQCAIKGIDEPDRHDPATPRLLSPWKDRARMVPAEGVHPSDILRPAHNRQSRRAMGIRRGRLRLGGVGLTADQMPWGAAS